MTRGVMAPGTEATGAIASRFGAEVLGPDGAVDRRRLASIVFADSAARRDLEAIVHPAVYRSIAAGLRAFELAGGAPLAVVDVPLLYETGRARDFDRVIVTTCPPELQIERLLARGMTEAEARQRMAAQWPTDRKTPLADFVIRTDGQVAETEAQVQRVFDELSALKTDA
jgi:dephospho-CoA kinase